MKFSRVLSPFVIGMALMPAEVGFAVPGKHTPQHRNGNKDAKVEPGPVIGVNDDQGAKSGMEFLGEETKEARKERLKREAEAMAHAKAMANNAHDALKKAGLCLDAVEKHVAE